MTEPEPTMAQIKEYALALLDGLERQAEAQEWASATSIVVLVTNAETHGVHLYGPFPKRERLPALAWARKKEIELNKGAPADELPFTATVVPMKEPYQ